MGLDTVELVVETEDRFGVKLTDADCARVRTVADLAALVLARLPKTEEDCPTARAFFDYRGLVMRHAGVERGPIRPRSRLEELFPKTSRRRLWEAVRKHDRRIPPLAAHPRVDAAIMWWAAILLFVWMMALAALCGFYGVAVGVPVSLAALVLGFFVFSWLSRLSLRHFPGRLETAGDVARAIAPIPIPQRSPGMRLIAQQRVLEEVRKLTALQLGLPLEKVRPESDFIRDLGAD